MNGLTDLVSPFFFGLHKASIHLDLDLVGTRPSYWDKPVLTLFQFSVKCNYNVSLYPLGKENIK